MRKKFAIDFSFLFSQECFKRIVQLEIVFFFNTFLILYPSLYLIPSRPSLVLKYKLWYRGLNPPPGALGNFLLVSYRLYFLVLNGELRAAVLTPPPPWRSVSKNGSNTKNGETRAANLTPPPSLPSSLPYSLRIKDYFNDGVGVFKYQLVARLFMFNVQLRNLFLNLTVVVFYSVRVWHMYYGSWQECWLSYTDLVTAGIL